MSDSELVYQSEIFPQLMVAIIYPESPQYELLSKQFKKSGHAFLLHDHNMMVVDGEAVGSSWFTPDHLLVIQAHEAGHYMAGHGEDVHTAGRDESIEREADWLGYNLLMQKGKTGAADLHRKEYEARYAGLPEEHDKLMTHLRKHLGKPIEEKAVRGKKNKRLLYHIGKLPAQPKEKLKWFTEWDAEAIDPKTGEKGDMVRVERDNSWKRPWLESPVKSGVFLTPNPIDIAQYHGRSGNVYTYKVPQWVIAQSGGLHRYDHGSEVLIPEDVWDAAGSKIEFLGKSMSQARLWEKVEKLQTDRSHRRGHESTKKPGWMSDEDWERHSATTSHRSYVGGLRSTKHPMSAIQVMKPQQRIDALAAFEKEYEDQQDRIIPAAPGERKGTKIPAVAFQPSEQDAKIIALLKKYINEGSIREYVRGLLAEANVLALGRCFPFAHQKAEEWFKAHFTKGAPGRRPKRHPDLNDKSKFKVVHGTVTDKWKQPPKPVVHGWVEMGDLVFDDQTKHTKPDGIDKEFYYDMFQPDPKSEYTAEEALGNCIKYGGEGPWDDDLYTTIRKRDAWLDEGRLLKEFEEISPERERHPRFLKTVGQVLDLIQRLQDETDKGGLSTRIKNVGVEFAKVAMGEIPIVGGALGAADGLYAMYQAGKDDAAHSWAGLEEYPILNRMDMHPTLARHLDPITLNKIDKAYQEYLGTLSRDTFVKDITDIDDFAREWILDDTTGQLDVELLREYIHDSLLKEATQLPQGYFEKIDGAVKGSRFWEESNDSGDIDVREQGGSLQTPAIASLEAALRGAFAELGLDVDIYASTFESDDPNRILSPDHPGYPNRWLIDARWYVSKQDPGRNVVDLQFMASDDKFDPSDIDPGALVRHITQTVRHELVHYHQMKKQAKNKGLDDTAAFEEMVNDPRQVPSKHSQDVKDYLNSHIEIDAHAHDGAEELLAVYGLRGAMDMIGGDIDLADPKLPNGVRHYFENLPPDSPTIKKLRSKLYTYLQMFSKQNEGRVLREGAQLGDCYEASSRYMLDEYMSGNKDILLVHAEVAGQGELEGITYGHAFCLDGGTVIDKANGRDLRLPAPIYYALGRINEIGNIYNYTYDEMAKKCLEYEHYGPWELETSTGL